MLTDRLDSPLIGAECTVRFCAYHSLNIKYYEEMKLTKSLFRVDEMDMQWEGWATWVVHL